LRGFGAADANRKPQGNALAGDRADFAHHRDILELSNPLPHHILKMAWLVILVIGASNADI
jgi:hypothetical protein